MKRAFREIRVSASGHVLIARIVARWRREDEARKRGPNAWRRLAAARRAARKVYEAEDKEVAA